MASGNFTIPAILIVFVTTSGVPAQERGLSADRIMMRMAEKYASVSSYQDEGVVETVSTSPRPTRIKEVGFRLYFSRPRRLRFEWVRYSSDVAGGRSVVWSDGELTFSLYGFEPDKVERKEGLGRGLASAVGDSLGSAVTISNLLSEEVGGFTLGNLARVSLQGRERFEGEDCYVLEGQHPHGGPWRLWVGEEDFLLRKLSVRLSGNKFKEEIHRNIKVNASIPAETFRLKVPGGGPVALLDREKSALGRL